MLSKIFTIVSSLLLMLLAVSASSHMANAEIVNFFVPNTQKLDIANPGVIIFLALGVVFIVVGLLFSGKSGGGSLSGLINYLSNGANPADLNSLDADSRKIVDFYNQTINAGNQTLQDLQNQLQQAQNNLQQTQNTLQETQKALKEAESKTSAPAYSAPQESKFEGTPFESSPQSNLAPTLDDDGFGPSNFSDFDDDDDDDKGAATVIASVPEELLAQAQAHINQFQSDPDAEFRKVFQNYYGMKQRCGESTAGLTEAGFIAKLKTTEAGLKQKHNCSRVEFSVTEKDGKASLKATPKF